MEAPLVQPPRVIGRPDHYAGLLKLVRARVVELGITHETVDAIAGLQSGYFSKIVCDPPMKRMGPLVMFLVFQALAMQVTFVDDAEMLARIQDRISHRLRPRRMPSGARQRIKFELNKDFLRAIGRKGGYKRAQNLSAKKLRVIGQMGAAARWK